MDPKWLAEYTKKQDALRAELLNGLQSEELWAEIKRRDECDVATAWANGVWGPSYKDCADEDLLLELANRLKAKG